MRFLEPGAVSDRDEGQADFMKLIRNLRVAPEKLQFDLNHSQKHKLHNICSILVKDSYPELFIDFRISKKLLRFQQDAKEGQKTILSI